MKFWERVERSRIRGLRANRFLRWKFDFVVLRLYFCKSSVELLCCGWGAKKGSMMH